MLWKGKNDEGNVSFIYQDLIKPKINPSGPETKYHITNVLGTYDYNDQSFNIEKEEIMTHFLVEILPQLS